jgi:16S rRNA (cytidine1402-2'-O)-methyltransferase
MSKLYLLPAPLGDESTQRVIPSFNISVLAEIEYIIAENEKTARKWMKQMLALNPEVKKVLQDFEYAEVNQHTRPDDLLHIATPLLKGKVTGFMSEAGCPGIADPGSEIVRICHSKNIEVIPLVGPSSILLALMASGMNGQEFCFHGYLPRERNDRIKRLREIEKNARHKTHILIETPYRNNAVLDDIIEFLHPDTRICIASNITLHNQRINTRTVLEWKKHKPNLDKIPVVFLISQ